MADRLLFTKTGRARYISHLDLMRTFQRAFSRAKIPIKHTEGFNPHPFVSIALPLSVGYSSQCEILEFGLLEGTSYGEVPERLTAAMPEGIAVHQCWQAERKLKELSYVNYIINMEYEEGRPQETETALKNLLSRDSLVVRKKSKKAKAGFTEVDLIPLIHSWNIQCQRDAMTLSADLRAQNPGLNPELIRASFCEAYPELAPDFVTFHRREVLDGEPDISIISRIEKTAQVIVDTADCAIGTDAASLVLMGLKGFRDDYEEHILHHRCLGSLKNPVPCVALCPAGVDIPVPWRTSTPTLSTSAKSST